MTGRFVVIGAGIVGASAAYRLARAGHEVVVGDVASPVAASPSAAGVISPGSVFAYGGEAPAGFEPLAVAASHGYAQLAADLVADGFPEYGYAETGALIAATDDDEQRRLDDVQVFVSRRRALGAANIGEPRMLTGDQARALHPLLGPAVQAALHLPEVARVDGRVLTATLRAAARRHGARFVPGRLVLRRDGGAVRAFGPGGARYDADAYLVAAGCWSGEVLAEVAPGLPVGAESGELLHCRVDGIRGPVPIIMGFVHTRYVLPAAHAGRHDGAFVLGATQAAGRTDSELHLGGIAAILAETLRVAPALADATFVRGTVGNRPVSPDRLPMLGALDTDGQVFVATGHGPYGLMHGPYCGRLVADLMTGREPDIDLTPYRPNRFASAAVAAGQEGR